LEGGLQSAPARAAGVEVRGMRHERFHRAVRSPARVKWV
jgi:hypothetical protein